MIVNEDMKSKYRYVKIYLPTCNSLKELRSISQSSSSAERLNFNSSGLSDSLGAVTEQHVGGSCREAVEAEHGQVLVVDLLLLCLLRQDSLRCLDTGKDPGFTIIGPVGSDSKTDLLRMSVSLIVSCQLEHLDWRSLSNITKPASAKDNLIIIMRHHYT